MDTIANRIDIAMRHAGIKSQADLARLSGVPNTTIVRILKDNSAPNVANLAAIARACKVSMDWIATGEQPQHELPPLSLAYVTSQELEILTAFRQASAATQPRIVAAIKALAISAGTASLN